MRRIYWMCFLLLSTGLAAVPTAHAMEQPIIGGTSDDLSQTATEYVRINDNGQTWHGTIERSYTAVPANTSGTFKNLKVYLTAAPGAGKSYAFTLMVGGTASALTCTVADTNTSCEDTTNSVSVTEKQSLSLRSVPAGTPALADATWSMKWVGSSAIVIGGTPGDLLATDVQYEKISGGDSSGSGTRAAREQLNATAGTLRNLYVAVDTAPNNGTNVESYQFRVIVDGAASGISCTISETSTSCEDAANTKALTGGELITLEHIPSFTPLAADNTWWGIEFVPTTSGESPIWAGDNDSPTATATEYNFIHGGETWNAAEASMYQLNQVCTLRDLYVKAASAPGSTKSFTFTLRTSDAADSLLACAVSGTATTCSDTADDISITDADNRLSVSAVPAGTPTTGRYYWGMTAFIQPISARKRLIIVD